MKEIKLTQGKVALVDDWNFEWLDQWKWYCSYGYAVRWIKIRKGTKYNQHRKLIYMHIFIMNTPEGKDTDHEDHNKCNNQEYNLRICTRSQNQMNSKGRKNSTSKYKGVHWDRRRSKWRAQIRVDGKKMHLGMFTCEKEAATAYDRKAKEIQGKYARLNFKEEV